MSKTMWMMAAAGLVAVGATSAFLKSANARRTEAGLRAEAEAARSAEALPVLPAMPEPPALPSCVACDATPLPEPVPVAAAVTAPPGPVAPPAPTEAAKPGSGSPEEIRRKVLEAAETMARLVNAMDQAKSDEERMEHMGELMQAALTLKRYEKSMTGDLAADVHMTMFDGVLPPGLRLSEEQKARYRNTMKDAEREMEMYGLSQAQMMGGDPATLTEAQRGHMARIQGNMATAMEQIMTPAQREHLHGMNQGGNGRFEIRIGGPGPGGEAPPPQSP